jgi:hypothetical protein
VTEKFSNIFLVVYQKKGLPVLKCSLKICF